MIKIGITMGCPVGIGPEIILSFLNEKSWSTNIQPVIIGDRRVLDHAAAQLGVPVALCTWRSDTPLPQGAIPVVPVSALSSENLQWGRPSRETGRAMAEYIETAVTLARQGSIQAITTCPISKESLKNCGSPFPGHTEMLASLTETNDYAMMLAGSRLRVTLVTIHQPLREVATDLSSEKILRLIRITHTALLTDFALSRPRIAVAGFNPHAGEGGLFGDEEQRLIVPAITAAGHLGINVDGPFPPDTVYFKAASGQFDAVVSMYHDQGLIPFKLLHFEDGVNVTLGLPIVRTSVDHGTAYDIAGKGLARHTSLAAAVQLAATIWANRTSMHSGSIQ
jgi:4-hydroxythreonine-4-phosphate dehydrogenase